MEDSINYLSKLYYSIETFEEIFSKYLEENKKNTPESFAKLHSNHLKSIYENLINQTEEQIIKRTVNQIILISEKCSEYFMLLNDNEISFWEKKEYIKLTYSDILFKHLRTEYLEGFKSKGVKFFDEIRDQKLSLLWKMYEALRICSKDLVELIIDLRSVFSDISGINPEFSPILFDDPDEKHIETLSSNQQKKIKWDLKWDKDKVLLTVLIIALHKSGSITNSSNTLTIKYAVEAFADMLNTSLPQFHSNLSKFLKQSPEEKIYEYFNELTDKIRDYIKDLPS